MAKSTEGDNASRMWIADTNRFGLEKPPSHWLQAVYDYDSQLVVLPSRKEPKYLLARRRFNTKGFKSASALLNPHPDTLMLDTYGVLPVLSFRHIGVVWNVNTMLTTLRARDLWAHGGGDAAADILDRQDVEDEQKRKESLRQDFDYRGKDAWRSYKARTGASTIRNTMRKAGRKLYSILTGRKSARETVFNPSEPAWKG